jgi:hypothetical protein
VPVACRSGQPPPLPGQDRVARRSDHQHAGCLNRPLTADRRLSPTQPGGRARLTSRLGGVGRAEPHQRALGVRRLPRRARPPPSRRSSAATWAQIYATDVSTEFPYAYQKVSSLLLAIWPIWLSRFQRCHSRGPVAVSVLAWRHGDVITSGWLSTAENSISLYFIDSGHN